MMYECYKLTFEHYVEDFKSGVRYKVEEPIYVQNHFDTAYANPKCILNSMLKRMEQEVLNKAHIDEVSG